MVHSSRIWSLMVGKAWRQEHEAAGHMVSSVRKHRAMDAGLFSSLFLCFIQARTPVHGMDCLFSVNLPIEINFIKMCLEVHFSGGSRSHQVDSRHGL